MDNKNQSTFVFTYSADEQDEVKKIRMKYAPQEESTLERLRKLDKSVTSKATVVSLVVGIVGALIMGGGMSLVMVGPQKFMILGIIIGILGTGVLAAAYPIYNRVIKRERERIAPEIIRLTDELMK